MESDRACVVTVELFERCLVLLAESRPIADPAQATDWYTRRENLLDEYFRLICKTGRDHK